MDIGWPQGIWLTLVLLSAGICWGRLGETKQGTYGFIECLIAPAISIGLLYWGGFFTGGCL